MPARTSPGPRQDARGGVLRELDISAARALTIFATVGTASAAVILFLFQGIPAGRRELMQGLLLAATVGQVVLHRLAGRSHPRLVLAVVLVANSTVMALLHLLMGVGVQGLGMGLSTLFIALGGMLVGARAAVGLALLNLLYVAGLYLAEVQGLIPGRALTAAQPSLNRAFALTMMIGAGVLAAMVLLRQYQQAFEEAALQRERLGGLLRIGTDWIWEQDAEGRFTHLSEAFAERSGLDPARFIGRTLWELPDAQMPDHDWTPLREAYARREPVRDEVLRLRAADGQLRLIAFTAEPAIGAAGKFGGWRGVGHDITRLMAESQRRRESERLLLRIFRTAPDGIALASFKDGRFVRVNHRQTEILGYSEAELIGRSALELGLWSDPDNRARMRALLIAERQVQNWPLRLHRRDGTEVPVLMSSALLSIAGEEHIITVVRDVSEQERERIEAAGVLENAPMGIALVRGGVFQRVNPLFEQLLGRPVGSLTGQSTRQPFFDDASFACYLAEAGTEELARGVVRELPIRRPDGSRIIGWLQGRAVRPDRPHEDGVVWLLEDITEQRRASEQLAAAKAQAEAASRAKSAFLATMSHEMRTPLNGALGMIHLARLETADASRRDEFLRHAEASGRALSQIISDILDLSRVEAGRLQLEQTAFDLHALAQSVHAVHAPQAQDKGLAFTLAIDPDVPRHVLGDPVRVRQVMVNFVANALKFTAHGRIELRLEPLAPEAAPGSGAGAPATGDGCGGVRISVHDTGVGIAPEVQPHLFQPFVQADASTTRRFGGTGLGLSICRELAQLMGGRCGLRSTLGEGSVFWAELPLACASGAPVAPDRADAVAQPLRGARVLVAEDHPVNMLIAVELLRRWGAEVDEVGDGAQAVEQVEQAHAEGRPYTAVLMDMHMPVQGGIEATQRLRQRHDARSLPIIALTAAALASEQRQALEAGMNDFVSKPFDVEHLLTALLRARAGSSAPAATA